MTRIKNFSDKYGICVLIVHHTRKMGSDDSFDMISGTNGLMGAADGAFVIMKKKRTENEAEVDVVGRDQQDQKLKLEFDRSKCIWNFVGAETDLWKPEPDPLLQAIDELLSGDRESWTGSPTALQKLLPDPALPVNAMTRKLNVKMGDLLNIYGIAYENRRSHNGRIITIRRVERKRDDCDGRDGISDTGEGVQNTVTIDTTDTPVVSDLDEGV